MVMVIILSHGYGYYSQLWLWLLFSILYIHSFIFHTVGKLSESDTQLHK